MDETALTDYITSSFEGVETTTAMESTFFFYGPEHKFPFATLVTQDDDYDRFSNLNRPGVFRLSIGVSKATFLDLFGATVADNNSDYDYTALDQLMPHPTYGKMYWVIILNPSRATFQEKIQPLLAEAYEVDVRKHTKPSASR